MKRLLLFCMLFLLLGACSPDKAAAPKEGRQSIGVQLNQPKTLKGNIKPSATVSVKTWGSVYANTSNDRPHARLSTDVKKKVKTISIGKGISTDRQTLAGPVVAEHTAYTLDAIFTLQATDISSGKVLWHRKLGPIEGTSAKSIGLSLSKGKLYATAGNGEVVALKTTGDELWRINLKAPLRSGVVVFKDKLFVSSFHNELFALDIKNGKVLWQYTGERAATGFFGMGTPAVNASVVVMPTTSGRVNVFDPETGVLLWTEDMWSNRTFNPILDIPHITASPVIDKNTVYLIGNAGKIGAYRTDNGTSLFALGIGGRETPLLIGNGLFLISNQNKLIALDKKRGGLYWETQLTSKEENAVWFGPVAADNQLIVTSTEGDIVFYDIKTGQETWRDRQDSFVAAPVIADDTILLLTTDGDLLLYH